MTNNNNSTHPIGRLYDTLEGRYVPQDEWAVMGDGTILINRGYESSGPGRMLVLAIPFNPDRYILERAIGHLDSQGKWIFEGDIVEKACGKGVVTTSCNIWKVVAKNGYSHTGIIWEDWTITGTIHDKE